MFRNQYDTDVTVWSPQGRLHQVEYAMEAVKQGSACLGLTSKTHAVLCALKRSPNELGSYQEKIMKIDDHMGISIAGLTADARMLAKYMRTEALNHKYVYGTQLQANRLATDLADMHQRCTQSYVRRPYGVGMLIAAHDATGPHLMETSPSGNYFEYVAMAIGARSQSAKTYLEKHYQDFPAASVDDLIKHGLKALSGCITGDKELDVASVSVAIVGAGQAFEEVQGARLQAFLDAIEVEGDAAAPAPAGEPEAPADVPAPMDEGIA
ncbi:20S proteasome subunit alpha type 1 [Tribonema minus]|uniref:Proteasome subunit alpha type n=1 Tax=Tribonema minus TaxID=303371 RepID=A0A836CE23_9STRA|nr:20S proteasome subunit alpha type 1 [Tribonema minus]|eukprot:TRINITY_DN2955_c1_g1_i1.p1 TRINITY_DN2955_c1_g1~~TRINITY_DN2955_c1_g1_i1.p1  ORF type:complete len:267 (-),score=88.51 TRINITY_DN2955_c1_g1_i1:117-917(-)